MKRPDPKICFTNHGKQNLGLEKHTYSTLFIYIFMPETNLELQLKSLDQFQNRLLISSLKTRTIWDRFLQENT